MIFIIWCIVLIDFVYGANIFNCPPSDLKFEKVLGLRPPNTTHSELLYQLGKGVPWRPVTSECVAKCRSNEECASFVLFYSLSRCYWYNNEDFEDDTDNVIDENVGWFIKKCFLTDSKCDKLWDFERIPGATLIGNDTKRLPALVTRTECEQYCLNETAFTCRSAKFTITNINPPYNGNSSGYPYGPNSISNQYQSRTVNEVIGTCTLSNADRHMLPQSYRVSSYGEEYIENQCAPNVIPKNEFCAYEEYDNTTSSHSDIVFQRSSKEDCQKQCDDFQPFNCRAYSIVDGDTCYLHSEDSKIYGPNALRFRPGSAYYERATCLNITVSCTETYMTIYYDPEVDFHGKMYMEGFFDNSVCSVDGQGKYHPISLKIPLLTGQCGITKANGPLNRTLQSGNLLIQFNSLIQTQNDRLIRVGCIFGNETKLVIGTGVQISPMQPNKGSVIIIPSDNSSVPNVVMKIVDPHKGTEISDTQIGQELQLQIILNQPNNLDIWASHLVAMTEKSDESIFLLDDRGCPTDLNIFPPLRKIVTREYIELVGNFHAFKFSDSPIVRFSVNVQFCVGECPPINCGPNIISYGRRKRQTTATKIETINGTSVIRLNKTNTKDGASVLFQMPLEYIMLVKDSNKYISDRLVVGDNKIVVAGFDYTTNEVCLDYSLVIALIILWILVQIFFVIGSVVLVKRYKRYYQHECTRQSMEELHKNFGIGFSNLENRRVHWADNENIL